MTVDNITKMSELNKVVSEIDQCATGALVYKRVSEYEQGLNDLKQEIKDVYTDKVINEKLNEYKESKLNEINNELVKYDEYSNALLSKANNIIHQLESDMQSLADPTTQYELEKHNYLVDKLKNNLFMAFIGNKPTIDEISNTLNQAKVDKGYARALTHLHAMLINNLENNNGIPDTTKQQLRIDINSNMEELKESLLPDDYKRLENIKQNINNNENLSQGQKHLFDLVSNIA
ncbi:hypothetical protein QI259_02480 [Staphylococcus saprophyticus]|nr:hypothetical protein [Staphylococcus saprophyticus]